MKLIVPMAGRGTRLRPHTHVTPKPLLPVVGRSLVERIVETFIGALPRGLDTPIGPLSLDFAVNPQAAAASGARRVQLVEELEEPPFRLHLTLGASL